MPYLQACIKEGLRIHPVVAVPLEQVVPKGGLTLSGTYFPAGTIIGCSPFVVARDEKLFPHPDTFRPERWLEASGQNLLAMERGSLAWGSGKRVCIGKNVAMLEMSKLIPQLLRRYSLELERNVDRTSSVKSWFTWIQDFDVVVKKREAPR
ncbi:uncharacterized protein MYCFIDRAFT_139090 [Pseudocercospora fijiensis CIRAD86]|uniref:P450 monooxygenase n=1 Tax=Pseudocercospora fijiensis (strain CIRAD86) TaxID=383855 RepID=M3AC13_PSEFD|nr:uncharacterized protein MYCFIDRAFT_139090 [Pseudocercospora fijiensis CIRAD86]EME82106.1 hypothetical protein MYCFIDRAFT_139090 [Pseudocercospora fijiensis CIRAD86]